MSRPAGRAAASSSSGCLPVVGCLPSGTASGTPSAPLTAPDDSMTRLVIRPHALIAHVQLELADGTPATASPGGNVTFRQDRHVLRTVAVSNGVARLDYTVPTNRAHRIVARFDGVSVGPITAGASKAVKTRYNPYLRVSVTSATGRAASGAFRAPAVLRVHCAPHKSKITFCSKSMVVRKPGKHSVVRKASAENGGLTVRRVQFRVTR